MKLLPLSDAADVPAQERQGEADKAAEVTHRDPYGAIAAHVARTSRGERAALARLRSDALQPHELAALARALLAAGLDVDTWRPETWQRWAMIAHGIALAGHDGKRRLGAQLAEAGVSESRVTKLLTSRGDAFRQLLPRLIRLLASQGVAPNWHELGTLVLADSSGDPSHDERAEATRLRIAGTYFSRLARNEPRQIV